MVEQINSNKFMSPALQQPQLMLKAGQIMYGKVTQLFPNNMAEIVLNGKKLTAQLNTPLSIGDRRYFQVTEDGKVPELKVIGEKGTGRTELDAVNILRTLGYKPGKMNKNLVAYLLKQDVTFTKAQLHKALQFHATALDKDQAKQIIRYVIERKLPMIEDVFLALQTKTSHSLTSLLQSLVNELETSSSQADQVKTLLSLSNQLLKDNPPLEAQMGLSRSDSGKDSFLRLISSVVGKGMIKVPATTDYAVSDKKMGDRFIKSISVSEKNVTGQMKHILSNKNVIQTEAVHFVDKWESVISKALAENYSIRPQQMQSFKDDAVHLMNAFSGQNSKQVEIGSSPLDLKSWIAFGKGLQGDYAFQRVGELISNEYTEIMNKNELLHHNFLNHIKLILKHLGINHEYQILHPDRTETEYPTIKHAVLQMLQQPAAQTKDGAEKMLHYINGAQLDSVYEMNNQLFAAIQIPGGKLGLPGDMELQAMGKKSPNGEIDKDFCRILFYLQLAALKDTVIDMHVQKRSVSITIFNNQGKLQQLASRFKPVLASGLKKFDYHLSSIHFKDLSQNDKKFEWELERGKNPQTKGVDFRI